VVGCYFGHCRGTREWLPLRLLKYFYCVDGVVHCVRVKKTRCQKDPPQILRDAKKRERKTKQSMHGNT